MVISMVTHTTTWIMKLYIEFDNLNCNSLLLHRERNKVLTSLKLQLPDDILPEGLSELCSALEVNTTLTKLDLSDNVFDDPSLTSLGKLLIITVAVLTVSEEVVNSWYNVSYALQLKMHYYYY